MSLSDTESARIRELERLNEEYLRRRSRQESLSVGFLGASLFGAAAAIWGLYQIPNARAAEAAYQEAQADLQDEQARADEAVARLQETETVLAAQQQTIDAQTAEAEQLREDLAAAIRARDIAYANLSGSYAPEQIDQRPVYVGGDADGFGLVEGSIILPCGTDQSLEGLVSAIQERVGEVQVFSVEPVLEASGGICGQSIYSAVYGPLPL